MFANVAMLRSNKSRQNMALFKQELQTNQNQ